MPPFALNAKLKCNASPLNKHVGVERKCFIFMHSVGSVVAKRSCHFDNFEVIKHDG